MSQTTDTATVISPDHPKPESQSIVRTQPLKGHQTHELKKEPPQQVPWIEEVQTLSSTS